MKTLKILFFIFLFILISLSNIVYLFPKKVSIFLKRMSPDLNTKLLITKSNSVPVSSNTCEVAFSSNSVSLTNETVLNQSLLTSELNISQSGISSEIALSPSEPTSEIIVPNSLNPNLVKAGGTSKEVLLKFYFKDKSMTHDKIYIYTNWGDNGFISKPHYTVLLDDGGKNDKMNNDHIFTIFHNFKPFFINQKNEIQFFSFNLTISDHKDFKKSLNKFTFSLNTLDTDEIHINF